MPVHTCTYPYILVHTRTYMYMPVHTCTYMYIPVHTRTYLYKEGGKYCCYIVARNLHRSFPVRQTNNFYPNG